MTEIAEIYLGNITQDTLLAEKVARRRESDGLLEVNLELSDRYKGRILTHSTSGVAIGIVKSRELQLRAGDVFQTDGDNLLLVHLKGETVMVLQFTTAIESHSAMQLVRLGHLLGNHHYPIKIEEAKIYVRLNSEHKLIERAIEDLNLTGLSINWERVDSLDDFSDR